MTPLAFLGLVIEMNCKVLHLLGVSFFLLFGCGERTATDDNTPESHDLSQPSKSKQGSLAAGKAGDAFNTEDLNEAVFSQSGEQITEDINARSTSGKKQTQPVAEEEIVRLGLLFYRKGTKKPKPFTGSSIKSYEDGVIEKETKYVDGKRHGISTRYNKDGSKNYEMSFKEDKFDGDTVQYYENGNKRHVTPYIGGKRHGMATSYYSEGGKMYEVPYVHGIRQGMNREYYKNGQIKSERPWVKNLQHGIQNFYHINGNMEKEVAYEDGLQQGLEIHYNEDETKEEETQYLYGKKHGTSISYYKDGSKKRVIPYKNGKKDGKETEYFPRGNIWKEKVWISGVMISEKSTK